VDSDVRSRVTTFMTNVATTGNSRQRIKYLPRRGRNDSAKSDGKLPRSVLSYHLGGDGRDKD
jgi:hypothetical protein